MNDHVVDIVLPPGTLLTSVCGIDLLPEDVGCALHFMEFCATFGEVNEIEKLSFLLSDSRLCCIIFEKWLIGRVLS